MIIHDSTIDNLSDQELITLALGGHTPAAFAFCKRAEHFGGMPMDGERIANFEEQAKEDNETISTHYARVQELEKLCELAWKRLDEIGTEQDTALINALEEA